MADPASVSVPTEKARVTHRFTYHARPAVSSPAAALRVNELLFVNAYMSNGRNGTQAYRTVFPTCKYTSAESAAARLLGKVRVQQELARRIEHEGGITKAMVESNLLNALAIANASKDAAVIASIAMDCAKLAGLITEKREVKTLTDQEGEAIRKLVSESLKTVGQG